MLKNVKSLSSKELGLLRRNISSGSLLVIRVRCDGSLANSEACLDCEKMLKSIGLKAYYHSTDSGKIVKKKLNSRDPCENPLSKGWKIYRRSGFL